MRKRFNELVIQTPEGVEFVYRLASPVVRCLALALDLSAISFIFSFLSVAVIWLEYISLDFAAAFYTLLYFILSIGYFIVLETLWRGQTIGKKCFRLQVVDASGLKLQPGQLMVRNLLRFIDALPLLYLVGGVCGLLSPRSQRLGDLAAGTVVVRIPEPSAPMADLDRSRHYNSFRDHPRLEALLRQRVSPHEAEIALQALRRRDKIGPEAQIRLFAGIAEFFRQQVAFPAELAAGLSDEQYVRNCVDSIYRKAK